MEINELSLNTNILSLGAILGNSGSESLIQAINDRSGGGSFFSSDQDPFKQGFQNFMSTVIEPIRQVKYTLAATANKLFKRDEYRSITDVNDLRKGIPPCMQLGVIYHPVVRKQLEEGEIDGFGIDPLTLCDEDPYEDVLMSGYCEVHSSNMNDKGEIEMSYIERTDAPEMTEDEIRHLRNTREFIDLFVNDPETRNYDVTDYPSLKS